MLLCRSSVLLHRGMGECESPMSCLVICLVAVIIPRFPRFDKYFIFMRKIISVKTPQSRFACQLPFQGSLFDVAPQKPPLKGEGDRLRWWGSLPPNLTSIRSGRNFSSVLVVAPARQDYQALALHSVRQAVFIINPPAHTLPVAQ